MPQVHQPLVKTGWIVFWRKSIPGISREGLDIALRKLALENSISKQDEAEVKPDPRWIE